MHENKATETESKTSYWTCPMHPQIHSEHAGECPICHMKLVQVKGEMPKDESAESENIKDRVGIQVSTNRLNLIGVQKEVVEKMDLTVKIPVSGRFISTSAVAFQVYESDLRYIKAGLTFRGESSTYSEAEFEGVISSVDNIIDPTSRTVRAIGSIKKGPSHIIPETSFSGAVDVTLKDRIAIAESSVLHSGQGAIVYVFGESNRLTPKKIKLGLKADSYYEVVSGLSVGDTISSGPNFLIDSEAKIRGSSQKSSTPKCPDGEHWDIPMSMCMPGKASQ